MICTICKAPSGAGPICEGCKAVIDKRRGQKGKAPAPAPLKKEHEGLKEIEQVLQADTKRQEAQAQRRKGGR